MTTRLSENEIVTEVLTWLTEESPEIQKQFKDCQFEDLISYHHTLGRDIRNHFGLWEYMWEPKLIDGVDCSEEHPDAISMRVIEKVWLSVTQGIGQT
jgi:hypothetical protein